MGCAAVLAEDERTAEKYGFGSRKDIYDPSHWAMWHAAPSREISADAHDLWGWCNGKLGQSALSHRIYRMLDT